jgi:hypothetical protein
MDDVTREVIDNAGPNGIDLRLYTRGEQDLPSVTTILKTRDEDKSNLYDWQDRNDGTGDNAYHKHLFWFSRHVGTLGHWEALQRLDPELDWSDDEQQSQTELFEQVSDDLTYGEEHPREGQDARPRDVLYSIMRGDANKGGGTVSTWGEFYDKHPPNMPKPYFREAVVTEAMRDVQFFADAQERLWSKLGITKSSVITVEQFLFEETFGFAGQVDLVYEDPNGYTVVADLKSSSGCYDKHQIQGAAYAKAVERESSIDVANVDRLEVHRAHPRTGQMAVHTHDDAPGQQSIHTTKYWNDSYADLWDRFESLIHNFDHYDGVDEGDLFDVEVDV